jgi:multicomponent Na+:H+ antiporter subunit B
MVKKVFVAVLLLAMAVLFYGLFSEFKGNNSLNPVSSYYAEKGPEETGAANLVTAVVVTYRGLDTLGEVTILFLAATIIGFFLIKRERSGGGDEGSGTGESAERSRRIERGGQKASELLKTGSRFLVPVIFLVGAYIFMNGHLTPGGGFQGGAVIASGIVLMLLTNPLERFKHKVVALVESLSGLTFVMIGILGILLAGGFLDNRIMSLGRFGTLLSAGAIPFIYILIGLKVGAELSNILVHLKESEVSFKDEYDGPQETGTVEVS